MAETNENKVLTYDGLLYFWAKLQNYLSDENFTTELKTKLNSLRETDTDTALSFVNARVSGGEQKNISGTNIQNVLNAIIGSIETSLSEKVDKDGDKSLTTNDFTNDYKNKLDGLKKTSIIVNSTSYNGDTDGKITIPTATGETVTADASSENKDTKLVSVSALIEYVKNELGKITEFDFKLLGSTEYNDSGIPTVSGKNGVIYLVPISPASGNNIYNEFIYISSSNRFEKIGTTDIDLSGYVKKEDIQVISNTDIDEVFDNND